MKSVMFNDDNENDNVTEDLIEQYVQYHEDNLSTDSMLELSSLALNYTYQLSLQACAGGGRDGSLADYMEVVNITTF